MSTDYWMANAELIYWNEQDRWLLGEDQHADWWVPFVPSDIRPYWDRFNKWNPLHWVCYWNSRRRKQVVFLDWDSAETVADETAWSKHD